MLPAGVANTASDAPINTAIAEMCLMAPNYCSVGEFGFTLKCIEAAYPGAARRRDRNFSTKIKSIGRDRESKPAV